MKNNVGKVVDAGLCMGCGVCQDACAKKCIKIHHGNDVNHPVVDESNCNECGLCLKVCAGKGIDIDDYSRKLFEEKAAGKEKYIGYYDKCFSGYSNNYDIRFHSASGGCLSQFLIYLLDKGYVDGAVVVGYKKNQPMTPRTYIARTREDVLDGRSSKYCVTSYEGILSQIKQDGGKYVIVGLPCHIQSLRKFVHTFKKVGEQIIGYFAIYCSSNRTMRSQDFLLYKYGVNRKNVARFAYRDNGCLGELVFEDKNRKILKSIPYQNYWIGMRGFFNVPRCSTCIDHFGELADVCFGDIHIGEYINDHIGINSLISRSSDWTCILMNAVKDGYLHLNEISYTIVKDSQDYAIRQKKGSGVTASFKLRSLLGKKNPKYDQPLVVPNVGFKEIVKVIIKCGMRWMGRKKWLWPIICKI
ncbi:Coenzyme F420 hydrogenase/dehydrogenase, beta subunit C-terminal domain [Xylanibacter muris]|uniref:4Fe-4S ferredoxin n=1 Tax=Xylanibacter muris TaxID=2736290 RepID=A0ABX2ASC4_9BACT|nr:Coenzyme F420 hydrogenase/dehydrogenase, beta subunit C-terminal domain [Xylanibacter muris]NPD92932.1 4Fe-4S ferredoxin [Xylanibacter muris]